MHTRLKPNTATLLATSLTLAGCGTSWLTHDHDRPNPVVQPEDFIGETNPTEIAPTAETASSQTDEPGDNASLQIDAPAPIDGDSPQGALPIDAMVGHINGEAVYAEQIFDINLIAQLESFGRRFEGDDFRSNATSVIQDRLQGIIINKLILGEAELNLQETQRRGIQGRIQSEREELLRFYGQGSLAKAKAEFKKARDKELEQHLVDFREELIIGSYVRSKVMPKIVVNQRDVERYYDDNIEKYHQPDQRIIRLMRAVNPDAALQIHERLGKGQPFEKIAADTEVNQYNPDNGGVFNGGNAVSGDIVIGLKPINDALLELESGQHAGPIRVSNNVFFVQVVQHTNGVKIELADVQIQIEQALRSIQFEKQALRFRMDLLRRGSYSDPGQMGSKLLDIASARYDK